MIFCMAPAQLILYSSSNSSSTKNVNGPLSTKLSPLLAKASLEDIAPIFTPKASSPINGRQRQVFFPPDFKVLSPILNTQKATPVSELTQEPLTLIGDGSKKCLLPCTAYESTIRIQPNVLVQLLDGVFSKEVRRFSVFDCRYPYEFDGGHIFGAVNAPNFEELEQCLSNFSTNDDNNDGRRNILVFHCEFSSQRAPSLLKQLRKADRDRNSERYPRLDYPEIYLLEGGYKAFYEYCRANDRLDLIDKAKSPQPTVAYVTMRDERFRDEERRWRRLIHIEIKQQSETAPTDVMALTTSDMTSPCCRALKIIRRDRSLSTSSKRHVRRLFDDADAPPELLSTSAPPEASAAPLKIVVQVNVAVVVNNNNNNGDNGDNNQPQQQTCLIHAATNETTPASLPPPVQAF